MQECDQGNKKDYERHIAEESKKNKKLLVTNLYKNVFAP